MSHPPPPLFILDFDGTITTADTITTLLNAAVTFQTKHDPTSNPPQKLDHVLSSYTRDYKSFHTSPPSGVKTKDFKNVEELVTYQRSLKDIEKASFERVSESGILAGISKDEWRKIAAEAISNGDVVIREGFKDFVERIEERGARWGIVSVNFCTDWIRAVLYCVLGEERDEDVVVFANQPDERGVLKGFDGGEVVCTSNGKRGAMRKMMVELDGEGSYGKKIYVGDSGTDVECLLEVDIEGVVMVKGDGSSKLVDMLESIGEMAMDEYKYLRMVRSIRNFDYEWHRKNGKRMWFAKDFTDILDSQLVKLIEK